MVRWNEFVQIVIPLLKCKQLLHAGKAGLERPEGPSQRHTFSNDVIVRCDIDVIVFRRGLTSMTILIVRAELSFYGNAVIVEVMPVAPSDATACV